MSKTLWHSELVKLSPVQVKVKKETTSSKFKGKPDFVVLEIDGEDRTYSVENEDCGDFFVGQKGRTFTIIAEGREDSAVINYVGESAHEQEEEEEPRRRTTKPPSKPVGKRPPSRKPDPEDDGREPEPERKPTASNRPPPPPPETPEQKMLRVKTHVNKSANIYLAAYAGAHYVREQIHKQFDEAMTPDAFQACIAMLAIQAFKDDFHGVVPFGVVNVAPKKEPSKEAA